MRLLLLFLIMMTGLGEAVDFTTDVLPVLRRSCYRCHGNGREKGDLSLEKENISKHIGPSGPIRPGKVEESKIIKLIKGEDGDRMPLKGPPLSEEEIVMIARWVEEGASLGKGTSYADQQRKALVTSAMWINTEGVEIVADLLGVESGKAILRLESGKIYRYPIEKLNKESQEKLANVLASE